MENQNPQEEQQPSYEELIALCKKQATEIEQLKQHYKPNWLEILADKAEGIGTFIKHFGNQWIGAKKESARLQVKMGLMALLVIALIIGSSLVLTIMDKMDGGTFSFLMGTLIGYALTFLREGINPS